MRKQGVRIDAKPQVLAAATGLAYMGTAQGRGKIIRTCQVPPSCSRVQHLHVGECTPADVTLEPAPDGLHLW